MLKELENIKSFSIINVLVYFLTLGLSHINSNLFFEPGYPGYASLFIIGTISSVCLILNALKRKSDLKINIIDIAFFVFIAILLIRSIFSDYPWIYSKSAAGIVLVPIYLYVRNTNQIREFSLAIVALGCLQLSVIVLQQFELLSNIDNNFKIGGTFGNPNILALFLSFTLPFAANTFYEDSARIPKNLLLGYSLIAIAAIISTKCRTAILVTFLFSLVVIIRDKKLSHKMKYTMVGFATLCLCVISLWVHTEVKTNSFYARLLIWKVSIGKTFMNPVIGYGDSSFHEVYPLAQAEYLATTSKIKCLEIADHPKWVYNDFIELWLEGGIFTMLSFLFIVASVLIMWRLIASKSKRDYPLAFISAILFFVVASVNFAFTAWPILLIFIISLAWCSMVCVNNELFTLRITPKKHLILVVGLSILGFYQTLNVCKTSWFQLQLKNVDNLEIDKQHRFYVRYSDKYQYYEPLALKNNRFLISQNQIHNATTVLRSYNDVLPSYNTNLQLAETYLKGKHYYEAKQYYKTASEFLPNRIDPLVQLYLLEKQMGNHRDLENLRDRILHTGFKDDKEYVKTIQNMINRQ